MNAFKTMTTTSALIALTLAAAGCQEQARFTRGEVMDEPLVIDQAMQKRQWEPQTAYVENGSTVNWSTGFAYEPRHNLGGYNGSAYYAADIGTFFVNLVTLPYTLWVERDGVESSGVVLPPSYTANPPLPPSPESAEPATPADAAEAAPSTQPAA